MKRQVAREQTFKITDFLDIIKEVFEKKQMWRLKLRIRKDIDRVTFQDLKIARVQLTWIQSNDFLSEISGSGFVLVARTSGSFRKKANVTIKVENKKGYW